MQPTSLSPNELSSLTALGQMPPVREGEAAAVLQGFDGVAREVAAVLLNDPSGADASEEAHAIAAAIRDWAADNRARASQRGTRSRLAVAG